jgi:hypothetical protein
MQGIYQAIRNSLAFLDNTWVSGVLTLLIVLYASIAAPHLPASVAHLFNNALFQLLFLFLIAYLSVKDASIACVLAIAFVFSVNTMNNIGLKSQLKSYIDALPSMPRVPGFSRQHEEDSYPEIDGSAGAPVGADWTTCSFGSADGAPAEEDGQISGYDEAFGSEAQL